MRIKRGEIAAAVVVVCAVVGIWAFGQVRARVEDDQRRSFEETHKERYPEQAVIVLDSEEQRQCVDDEGHAYSADFGWEGRMEAVVEEPVFFDDPSKVPGLNLDEMQGGDGSFDSVLAVKIKLTNVSAESLDAKDGGAGSDEFHAGIFRLQGVSIDNEVLLAGKGDLAPTPNNRLHFVLPPGESTTLEIAYGVDAPDGLNQAVLNIGAVGSGADKISVDLAPVSVEGGEA
ncbi:hypothetical protein [Caniella muris]|uniref:hypothetical protein n=1 Tax=Caniella muris TaxID=2941502 RepID=UPI00203B8CF2|nr:hypothetical protein [Caniella muris]